MRRHAWAIWLAVFCASCSGKNDSNLGDSIENDGVVGDVGQTDSLGENRADAPVCEKGGDVICCPGESNGCGPDGRSLLVCNSALTGWDLVSCIDKEAKPTICRATPEIPGGYCTDCTPGARQCGTEDVVLQCNEAGKEFVELENCEGATTGRVCYQGACLRLCEINEKLNIYMGCDFWGVDLDNAFVPGGRSGFYDAAGEQYSIVVSNTHDRFPATVTVYNSEGEVTLDSEGLPLPSGDLLPGELRIYNLPRRDADGTLLKALAYRVVSSIPISVYQFNPLENVNVFSNDASLLLPSGVNGRYYFVMTREQSFDELRGYLTVVAIRDGITTVNMDLTAPTLAGINHTDGSTIPHFDAGASASFSLKQFDVLNIETNEIGADLTGSVILASKDVVVFGGSEAANAPNTNHCLKDLGVCEWDGTTPCQDNLDCTAHDFNTCCADHLEMQLFPVKSWGKKYLASRTFPRGKEKDVYRIIAAENGTLVTTVPPVTNVPVLNKGEWVDFESDQNFEIVATKPIMVGQFLAAQDAPDPNPSNTTQPGDAGIGDPAFLLLVPNEQFRQDYVFLAPNKYELDYVTITAPKGAKVWYDCGEIDPDLIPISCDPLDADEFELFGTGEYATIKFKIEDGVHRLYSDKDISVYVYGYDQYVSYGYPAGLNIKDLGLIKEPGEL